MPTAHALIERAFARLAARPGYTLRTDQKQLALLLGDFIEGGRTGAVEAPTGLGKSLAALIPAIACAMAGNRRTVIATYTNVLAEQYWRRDLPFALSLFEEDGPVPTVAFEPPATRDRGLAAVDEIVPTPPKTAFMIGRSRYVCLTALEDHHPDLRDHLTSMLDAGIETEFRQAVRKPSRELNQIWSQISAPPVCPGRLCPAFHDCYYFKARRDAEKAQVVITNHSVVIQHAILQSFGQDSDGMLGKFDFLILDEAHDFPQAAFNGLEFELSAAKLNAVAGIASRLEQTLAPAANKLGEGGEWSRRCDRFRADLEIAQRKLTAFGLELDRGGILTASPAEVLDHPQVKLARTEERLAGAREVASAVSEIVLNFTRTVNGYRARWKEDGTARHACDAAQSYVMYLQEVGGLATTLFEPQGVSVSHASTGYSGPILRRDIIGLADPLRELIWDRQPYACLSATLALDGNFDFFRRTTGAEPEFEEVLPTPFDFGSQAALYLPKEGRIPDPTIARREGREDEYHWAVAKELSEIIRACDGRTLALFHSRKEMEAVRNFIDLGPDYPILMQMKSGNAATGERFVNHVRSTLFALRSFWTGFDAPGETCSCVVLVRVPFEVPVDPPQIARLAWMQTQGLDAFREHTLPQAKMLMRQGAGRLIRRAEDRGIIALLDPRLRSKMYGEEILANLPPEMRTFTDIVDAVGWIGLEPVVV